MKLTRTHLTKPSVAFRTTLAQALAAHPHLVLGVGATVATVAAVGARCATPALPMHVIATAATHALTTLPMGTGGPGMP